MSTELPPATSISANVRKHLAELPILTRVSVSGIADRALLQNKKAISAALDYYAAGTGVSMRPNERGRPNSYYAIRLALPCSHNVTKMVYASLPGISRQLLTQDARREVEQIVEYFREKYGKETIDYWAKSAQFRSVDICRSQMERTKKSQRCRLCSIAHEVCENCGIPSTWLEPRKISACHIVPRKTVFWRALKATDLKFGHIFSDIATRELKGVIQNSDSHSNERYIASLCPEHDRLLQRWLTKVAV